MKKVILMAILFSKAIIADGTMTITGNILPSATVGFDAITENLIDDKRFFKDKTIDIGVIPLGGYISPVTQNIYVKTNIPTGVAIKISDHNGYEGSFKAQHKFVFLEMKYKLMNNIYNMATPTAMALCNSIKDGSASVGTFLIEQDSATSSSQTPDTYSATFDVEITAN